MVTMHGPAMAQALITVREVLEAGMTTNSDPSDLWYIKTWYVNDPIALDYPEYPFAVIKPGDPTRVDQYVQEDTAINPVIIIFFPTPINVAADYGGPANEQIAMRDKAVELLRRDPTQGHRVFDTQVMGSVFRQPGFTEGGVVYSAEVRCQLKQRALWNA